MSKITELTTDVTIHTTKSDDGWDYPISREEWEEIMYSLEQERIGLETLAEEEEERKREERNRRSRGRLNDPYIFDSFGFSYEDLEEPDDLYEW